MGTQKGYASWHLVGTLDHRQMKEIHGWIFGHRFISLKFSAIFLVMVPLAKVTPKALGERILRAASSPTKTNPKKSEEFVAKNFAVSESVRELKSMWVHLFEPDENPLSIKQIQCRSLVPEFWFCEFDERSDEVDLFLICRLGIKTHFFFVPWSFFQVSENCFPETNIAPVRRPSQKKTHLPTPVFQVLR